VWDVYLALHDTLMAAMNDIPVEVHVGWRYGIEQSATRDAEDVEAFQSKVDELQPLHGGYEVQDEDGYFYLGGVNGGKGPREDLNDPEQEIILDSKVQIVNLEADEQPDVFDLTPDENSDEADEALIDRYLMTQSPVKT